MNNKKHVILCIDDDKEFLDSLKIILESEGYAIALASSAEEGKKKYKEVKPDLMIVDLMMEEIDSGVGLVKDLKSMGAKQPIYMLSSVGDNLNRNIDYTDLGLTGVFQKPINPHSLITTLKSVLK